jgi:hypothetical protein
METSDQEFLQTLHREKIRTQNERTDLVKKKLAFITVLFGIGSASVGFKLDEIFWILYFVPLVAVCFDLYIMSADSRIKRIGAFLGRHPNSDAGKAEREWENFCVVHRDNIATIANIVFSIIGTLCSAVLIRTQQSLIQANIKLWFSFWLIASLVAIIGLWRKHQKFIEQI